VVKESRGCPLDAGQVCYYQGRSSTDHEKKRGKSQQRGQARSQLEASAHTGTKKKEGEWAERIRQHGTEEPEKGKKKTRSNGGEKLASQQASARGASIHLKKKKKNPRKKEKKGRAFVNVEMVKVAEWGLVRQDAHLTSRQS